MTDTPLTLLAMQGAPTNPAPLASASLIVIDLQGEYRSDVLPLENIDRAVAETAKLIDLARANGVPVIHVWHEVGESAPIFNPKLPSFAPMAEVAPINGEAHIVKHLPNSFAGTDLHARLRASGRKEIIVVGAQTHMCISATVRAALDLGYRSTVVADACATRALPTHADGVIAAKDVHDTALAELADAFAVVVPNVTAWDDAGRASG